MTDAKSYKATVNLPKTTFKMRANAPQKEPEIQAFWEQNKVYKTLAQTNSKKTFTLHDGPPYANGDLHMGHALNKVLKDIIIKYKLLQGYKTNFVPGWDCHGLPIELKVLQSLKSEVRQSLTPLKLRYKARDFALKTQKKQARGFQRYGIWGDWDAPYLTLTPEYEAAQIEVFGAMALKGYIYRGFKPVHWSPSSQTALAEAELEYPENHTSQSIYVSCPLIALSEAAQPILGEYSENLGVAIWTTTPWTLPGNLAVAINPALEYAVIETDGSLCNERYLIVAKDLVETLTNMFESPLTVKATFKGSVLEHCTYQHPLYERQSPVVAGGDYITTESGTGLVHTAPGHGQEDYITGQKYGLPLLSPVDAQGILTEEAGEFAGLNVLEDANDAIIAALQNKQALLKEEAYGHKYPYDWRTKEPTIFRATEQWFASVEGFRAEALNAIKTVQWIPAQGENRITPMVSDRSDWCISRQRNWGVPIPVFYDEETGEALLNADTIDHVKNIIATEGSDAWWKRSVDELLPEAYRNDGRRYRKGTDTMDVWFDSGSSWAAVANQRQGMEYPVDIYLEGSDQHRGWFQSSLLTSVAVNGVAPYKTVLTHGFVLDEKGYKMSKSLGNVVDPDMIINGGKNQKLEPPYGADVLRLWVSSVDYSSDVPLGQTILKQLADVYRKIRNTARFLLGNIHDFDSARDAIAYEDLSELDQYILYQTHQVFSEITDAFENFQFFKFFQKIQNFCVVDLSNFYLDIAKDRLYISDANAPRRRSCQTVMAMILETLTQAIAPVLCHMAEDIWQNLPYSTPHDSIFNAGWYQLNPEWIANADRFEQWDMLRDIRTGVNLVLEQARTEKLIGASLEAKILIYAQTGEQTAWLEVLNPADSLGNTASKRVDELRYLLLVSQVEFVSMPLDDQPYQTTLDVAGGSLQVAVMKADGHKCERCWNYSPQVGLFPDDPTICERCNAALAGQF